ncbi:hypothetical protein H4R34_002819 [Dimargaris verticillata]|uniref:Uncharacterized protein n=1 Tax=Dimargaris verticillata TaxID=2761393 RepID=A0A9W8B8R6_9FUNG|nr:hypothetical protein H4R34_002819 [Dimargaris verticillata]
MSDKPASPTFQTPTTGSGGGSRLLAAADRRSPRSPANLTVKLPPIQDLAAASRRGGESSLPTTPAGRSLPPSGATASPTYPTGGPLPGSPHHRLAHHSPLSHATSNAQAHPPSRRYSAVSATRPTLPSPSSASGSSDSRRQTIAAYSTHSPPVPFPRPPAYPPPDTATNSGVIPFPRMAPSYAVPPPGSSRAPEMPYNSRNAGHIPRVPPSHHMPPSPGHPMASPYALPFPPHHYPRHHPPQPQLLANMAHQPPMPPLPSGGLTDHWTDAEVDTILAYIKNNFQLWQQSKAVSYRKCREQLPNRSEKQIKNKVEKLITKYHKLCTWKATTSDPHMSVRSWKWYTKLHDVFHSLEQTGATNKGLRAGPSKSLGAQDDKVKQLTNPDAKAGDALTATTTSTAASLGSKANFGPPRMASPSVTAASSSLLALAAASQASQDPQGGRTSAHNGAASPRYAATHHPPPLSLPPVNQTVAFPRAPPGGDLSGYPGHAGYHHTGGYRGPPVHVNRLRSHSASVAGEHPSAMRTRHMYEPEGYSPYPMGHPTRPHRAYTATMPSPHGPYSLRPGVSAPHSHPQSPHPGAGSAAQGPPTHYPPTPPQHVEPSSSEGAHRPRRMSMPVPPSNAGGPAQGPTARPTPYHSMGTHGPLPTNPSAPTTPQRSTLCFSSDDIDGRAPGPHHLVPGSSSGYYPPYAHPSVPHPMTPGRYSMYRQGQVIPRTRVPTGHHHRHRHSVMEPATPTGQSTWNDPSTSFSTSMAPASASASTFPTSVSAAAAQDDPPCKRRKSFHGHVRPSIHRASTGDVVVGGPPMSTTQSNPGYSASSHATETEQGLGASTAVGPSPLGAGNDRPHPRPKPVLALADQALHEKRKRVISRDATEGLAQLSQLAAESRAQKSTSAFRPSAAAGQEFVHPVECQRSASVGDESGPQHSTSTVGLLANQSGHQSARHGPAQRHATRRRAATVSEGTNAASSATGPSGQPHRPTPRGPSYYPHPQLLAASRVSGRIEDSPARRTERPRIRLSNGPASAHNAPNGMSSPLDPLSPMTAFTSSPMSPQNLSPTAMGTSSTASLTSTVGARKLSTQSDEGKAMCLTPNQYSVHPGDAYGPSSALLSSQLAGDLAQFFPLKQSCRHIKPFVSYLVGTLQELLHLKDQEIVLHHELQQVLDQLRRHHISNEGDCVHDDSMEFEAFKRPLSADQTLQHRSSASTSTLSVGQAGSRTPPEQPASPQSAADRPDATNMSLDDDDHDADSGMEIEMHDSPPVECTPSKSETSLVAHAATQAHPTRSPRFECPQPSPTEPSRAPTATNTPSHPQQVEITDA